METKTSSASFTSIIYNVSLLLTATHAERVDVEISSFRIFCSTRDGRKETKSSFHRVGLRRINRDRDLAVFDLNAWTHLYPLLPFAPENIGR